MPAIDLRSDTVTKPTPPMRDAMARAPVGDDVYGEDPTVNRLQDMVAELLDKEAALFVPSGVMANQLAIRAQTERGQEVILDSRAHVVRYEQGAAAALAGVQLHGIATDRGLLSADQVAAAIRPRDSHSVTTGLVCVENTHNSGGGSVYPLTTLQQIRAVAAAHGVPVHLDGARLFNAAVASGVPAAAYARQADTVSVCLSKGLGAPVGSVITGPRPLIERMRPLRRMYGGGMRQAGILAAAGIYALEHHVARLKDDHEQAQRLARGLGQIRGVAVRPEDVETNIVIFELVAGTWTAAADAAAALREAGVLVNAVGPRTLRAVTHLDVGAGEIDAALAIMARILA